MTDLASLVEMMCQGTATRADRDRLESLLRDPANRSAYLAASRLHSELLWRWHRGRFEVLGPREAGRGPRLAAAREKSTAAASLPRPGRGSAAAFAGLVLGWLSRLAISLTRPVPLSLLTAGSVIVGVLMIAAAVTLPSISSSGDAAGRLPDAWITGAHEAKWRSSGGSFGLADPLRAGTTLDLESGLVEIRYGAGATVVLEGPAVLRVEGRAAASLTQGRLTAKLEKAGLADGGRRAGAALPRLFTVHTPKASVHDLGTEFGVEVREAGTAEVHVFDGLVELTNVVVSNEAPDTSRAAPAMRLAAGDSAQVDEAGRIKAAPVSGQAFVRSLPRPAAADLAKKVSIPWNDATAEIMYRDAFRGSGPLDGTSPASRGGVGTAAWRAIGPDWGSLDASGERPGLQVAGEGHALLPFKPEPGYVYKLTVTLDVTAGGVSGMAFGMRAEIPSRHPLNVASAGQRHDCSAGEGIWSVNALMPGPGNEWRLLADRLGGRQTRSVLLDTTGDRWQVAYHVGDRLLGMHVYPKNPTAVEHIGLHAGDASVRGCVASFELARNKAQKEAVR
jgi:hypothetical protein